MEAIAAHMQQVVHALTAPKSKDPADILKGQVGDSKEVAARLHCAQGWGAGTPALGILAEHSNQLQTAVTKLGSVFENLALGIRFHVTAWMLHAVLTVQLSLVVLEDYRLQTVPELVELAAASPLRLGDQLSKPKTTPRRFDTEADLASLDAAFDQLSLMIGSFMMSKRRIWWRLSGRLFWGATVPTPTLGRFRRCGKGSTAGSRRQSAGCFRRWRR